jgi:predicted phosphodiesterase
MPAKKTQLHVSSSQRKVSNNCHNPGSLAESLISQNKSNALIDGQSIHHKQEAFKRMKRRWEGFPEAEL